MLQGILTEVSFFRTVISIVSCVAAGPTACSIVQSRLLYVQPVKSSSSFKLKWCFSVIDENYPRGIDLFRSLTHSFISLAETHLDFRYDISTYHENLCAFL